MKFKKILALSLVATVITTGIPNIEMFNRVENVLAADAIAPGESIVLDGKDYCELRDTLELKNIDNANISPFTAVIAFSEFL